MSETRNATILQPGRLSHEVDDTVPGLEWLSNPRHQRQREAERRGDALIAAGGLPGQIVAEARANEQAIRDGYAKAIEWTARHPGEEPTDEVRAAIKAGMAYLGIDANAVAQDMDAMQSALAAEARARPYLEKLKSYTRSVADLQVEREECIRKAEEAAKPFREQADRLECEALSIREAVGVSNGQSSVFSDLQNNHPRLYSVIPRHPSVLVHQIPLSN